MIELVRIHSELSKDRYRTFPHLSAARLAFEKYCL